MKDLKQTELGSQDHGIEPDPVKKLYSWVSNDSFKKQMS